MSNLNKTSEVRNMIISAFCLALCMVLPLLTMQVQPFGVALAPMHIPVLICGFICGGRNATLIGAIAPLLRFMVFGTPPIMPMGIAMSFELAMYGIAVGLLAKLLPKKAGFIYVTLISAMLLGRVVWGVAMWRISGIAADVSFTMEAFIAGAFVEAVPGIVLHIAIIPPIIMIARKISNEH
jgi:riboflavin transporter FmnP